VPGIVIKGQNFKDEFYELFLRLLELLCYLFILKDTDNTIFRSKKSSDIAIVIHKISPLVTSKSPLISTDLGDYKYNTFKHFWHINEYNG
jgi:hypothetical protein